MEKKTFWHHIADINERDWEIEKEVKKVKFNIMVEDDEERKNWFINALNRLENEKEELHKEKIKFQEEHLYNLED